MKSKTRIRLAWELKEGIRNWLFPGLLSVLVYIGSYFAPGSSGYVHFVAFFLCLISLIPVYFIYKLIARKFGLFEASVASIVFGFFCYFVYMAPKALFEVFAAHMFFIALYIFEFKEGSRKNLFLAGFFCGLCAALRLQYAPAVLLLVLWFTWKDKERFLSVLVGASLMLFVSGMLDVIVWKSVPFYSYWGYFHKNIIEGISHKFGVSPWYNYWKLLSYAFGNCFPFFLVFALIGTCFYPLGGLLFLSVLIPHSFVAHKELRFIYLGSLFLILLALVGTAFLMSRYKDNRLRIYGLTLIWSLMLFSTQLRSVGDFFNFSEQFQAYKVLSVDKEMCGLGTVNINNAETYYHLHSNVPIYTFQESDLPLKRKIRRFNRLLCDARRFEKNPAKDFKLERCFSTTCIYRREGTCVR